MADVIVYRVGLPVTESLNYLNAAGVAVTGATITTVYARYGTTNTSFVPTVTEIGNGEYQVSFTPTVEGKYRALFSGASPLTFWEGEWDVQAESARADEPFAWRTNQTVTAYFGLVNPVTGAAITGATIGGGSLSLLYFRDPNSTTYSAYTFAEIGNGEYRLSWNPTIAGLWRAELVHQPTLQSIEIEVLVLDAITNVGSDLTELELIEDVARRLSDRWTGTLTTGSATVPADTVRYEEDSRFKGGTLYLTTGAGAGQYRTITAFANAGGVFTVSPGFSPAPSAGDGYLVTRRWSFDQIRDALLSALRLIRKRILLDVVDETTVIASSTYQYVVPAGINIIGKVAYQDASYDDQWWELPEGAWHTKPTSAGPVLVFEADWLERRLPVGRFVQIIGQSYADTLSSVGDKTLAPANFLIARACYELLLQRGQLKQAVPYVQEAEAALAQMTPAAVRGYMVRP